jgi:hypothetical protein
MVVSLLFFFFLNTYISPSVGCCQPERNMPMKKVKEVKEAPALLRASRLKPKGCSKDWGCCRLSVLCNRNGWSTSRPDRSNYVV